MARFANIFAPTDTTLMPSGFPAFWAGTRRETHPKGLFRATVRDIHRRLIKVLIQLPRLGRRAAAIPQRPNADDAHPPSGEERENVARL